MTLKSSTFKEYITKWRLKTADRIMRFCLDRRINNIYIIEPLFKIYTLLIREAYIFSDTDSNHHYIPQFLLRNFKIPGTGNIYEYTFNKAPVPVSIEKHAALVKNLYLFRDKTTKKQSDFIEKQLFAFSVEKYASRIIKLLLNNADENLTYLEESILTSFVGLQYTRTPDFFRDVSMIITFLNQGRGISLEEMIKPDFFRKAFIDNYYKITPREVGAFGLKNKLTLTGAEPLILKIAISVGNELSELIYRRDLRVVMAKEPAFFYLTGSPADIYNLAKERSVGPFLWEMQRNSLIFLPIAPNVCVYYLPRNTEVSPHVIGNIIQEALSKRNTEFAYSDRKSPDIEDVFKVPELLTT